MWKTIYIHICDSKSSRSKFQWNLIADKLNKQTILFINQNTLNIACAIIKWISKCCRLKESHYFLKSFDLEFRIVMPNFPSPMESPCCYLGGCDNTLNVFAFDFVYVLLLPPHLKSKINLLPPSLKSKTNVIQHNGY